MQLRVFFFLCTFFANTSFAQTSLPSFRYLTTDNGLSQAINYSILKDSKGFVWITSSDGLNKFDSRNNTQYRDVYGDTNSFKGTLAFGLVEDKSSNIWCGSNTALNIYSRKNNTFKSIIIPGNYGNIYTPLFYFNNYVYFKTGNNLYTCNISTFVLTKINIDDKIDFLKYLPKVFETSTSFHIFFLSKPLLSSSQFNYGVRVFEVKKNNANQAALVFSKDDARQYYDVIPFEKNNFLVASNNQLLKLNVEKKQLEPYLSIEKTKKIVALTKTKQHIIISVQNEGLYTVNEATKTIEPAPIYTTDDILSLKKNEVQVLYTDQNNFLWISLWGKGIGYVNLTPSNFNLLFDDIYLKQNNVKDKYIVSVKCDTADNVWLATRTDGVYSIKKNGKISAHINFPNGIDKIRFGDTYLFRNNKNEILVGCQNGVYKINTQTKTLDKQILMYQGKEIVGVNDIFTLQNNDYLISTQTGIYSANNNFDELKFRDDLGKSEVYIRSLLINNKLLFTCKPLQGTVIYQKQNNQFLLYDSIKINSSIKHISADKNPNIIWLASTIGIIKYQISEKKYTVLNSPNLLVNTYDYSVLADEENNFWVSHNKGISKLNLEKNQPTNYSVSDGLQGNEYNTTAFDKAKDGTMFFGGTNGLNVFNPATLDSTLNFSTLQIIDFKINDKAVNEKYNLSNFDTLTLAYRQNTVSFIPLIINYFNYEDDECLYKIEGIDNTWLEGRSNSLIRYSNLPAGKYTLLLKPKKSITQTTIFIIVQKPFWLSPWFILLMLGLTALLIWLAIRSYYLQKVKKHKAELEKQKAVELERTRIAADMHDDLGSGLTKITYLSQLALNKENTKDDLQNIKKTSTGLVESMSEIIWAMKEENNTLSDLIIYLKTYALEYCQTNNLVCTFHSPLDLPESIVDGKSRRNIYLAAKEVLHNIVKHAKATSVGIDIKYSKNLTISIADNGVGLKPKNENKTIGGNGIKNIEQRIKAVNGHLQIVTQNGTKFIFTIPI